MISRKVKEELKTEIKKNVTNLHHANVVGDSSDQVMQLHKN